jgi:uncharacterized protein
MNEGKLLGQGISFPPRVGADGRIAWSAGTPNISESIQVILLTELQERLMLPEFGAGLRSFLFRPNSAVTHRLIEERVLQALARWEPRIRVEGVTVLPDVENVEAATVIIAYKLVATGARDQASLTVNLAG